MKPSPFKKLMAASILSILCSTSYTFGQSTEGGVVDSGSGYGYQLPDGTIHTLELYEAEKEGAHLNLGGDNLNYIQKVEYALNSLAKVAPARANQLKKVFNQMLEKNSDGTFKNIEWNSTEQMFNPKDLSGTLLPMNSRPVLLAFQRNDKLVDEYNKKYVFDASLFQKLDEDSKAMIMIHEMLYTHIFEAKFVSSQVVRKIAIHLFDKSLTLDKYNELQSRELFGNYEYQGEMAPIAGIHPEFPNTNLFTSAFTPSNRKIPADLPTSIPKSLSDSFIIQVPIVCRSFSYFKLQIQSDSCIGYLQVYRKSAKINLFAMNPDWEMWNYPQNKNKQFSSLLVSGEGVRLSSNIPAQFKLDTPHPYDGWKTLNLFDSLNLATKKINIGNKIFASTKSAHLFGGTPIVYLDMILIGNQIKLNIGNGSYNDSFDLKIEGYTLSGNEKSALSESSILLQKSDDTHYKITDVTSTGKSDHPEAFEKVKSMLMNLELDINPAPVQ